MWKSEQCENSLVALTSMVGKITQQFLRLPTDKKLAQWQWVC